MFDLIDRLQWGVDKRATLKVFAGFQHVGDHPTQNGIGLAGEVFGYSAFAVCYFAKKVFGKDSLVRVNIMLPAERADDATSEAIFESIQSDISRKVGRTPHNVEGTLDAPPEFRMSKMCVWRQNDTIITLALTLERDGGDPTSPPIGIGLGHVKNDPVSVQWDWLES